MSQIVLVLSHTAAVLVLVIESHGDQRNNLRSRSHEMRCGVDESQTEYCTLFEHEHEHEHETGQEPETMHASGRSRGNGVDDPMVATA